MGRAAVALDIDVFEKFPGFGETLSIVEHLAGTGTLRGRPGALELKRKPIELSSSVVENLVCLVGAEIRGDRWVAIHELPVVRPEEELVAAPHPACEIKIAVVELLELLKPDLGARDRDRRAGNGHDISLAVLDRMSAFILEVRPVGEVVHEVADLVRREIVLQIDDLLHSGERHHAGTLRAGFQRRIKRYLAERCGMWLVIDPRPGLPAVIDVREAEQPPHQPRFGVLCRAPEKSVVVEIKVDDVAVAVDRDAGDIVPEIPVPFDMSLVGSLVPVS